jgi:glycine/D-amino acid oxidase-like deaminating enzyme
MEHFDFALIGGGVPGVSAAFEFSKVATVVLVERVAARLSQYRPLAAAMSENCGCVLAERRLVPEFRMRDELRVGRAPRHAEEIGKVRVAPSRLSHGK